ncbi:uncharacterized protein C2845_PM05G03620 [Panicum miliaceum]|uniref:Uncharacterized protein n=1 Tax=Panicum miliaceum TaxID=4540 RepID=A0A3L6T0G6_PANMI|nr:uncharacterized protein C2845_PM05G03620 [Panicum miliaceum]
MTLHLHRGKENTFNLVAYVPKTELLLNVFNHGLDGDAEFMKPGADISIEELKSSDLSAAVNVKRHQCKGQAALQSRKSKSMSTSSVVPQLTKPGCRGWPATGRKLSAGVSQFREEREGNDV